MSLTPPVSPPGDLRPRVVLFEGDRSLAVLQERLEGRGMVVHRLPGAVPAPAPAALGPLLAWAEVIGADVDDPGLVSRLAQAAPEPAPVAVAVLGEEDLAGFRAAVRLGAVATVGLAPDPDALADLAQRIAAPLGRLRRARLAAALLREGIGVVAMVDDHDQVVLASQNLGRLAGRPASELEGLDVDDVVPELLGTGNVPHQIIRADGDVATAVGRWLDVGDQRAFCGRNLPPAGDAASYGAFVENRLKLIMIEAAHDVNNKTQVITFNLANLTDELESPRPDPHNCAVASREIMTAVRDIVHMNNTMRAFGHTTVARSSEELDLRGVANDMLAQLRLEQPDAPGLSIAAGPPMPVFGPRNRLGQTIANIVRNAIIAVRGVEDAAVGIHFRDHPARVRMVVEDNGLGVAMGDEEQVFLGWWSQFPDDQELGLGLLIARKIANECGGDVWVEESELGGAAFVLDLPRAT